MLKSEPVGWRLKDKPQRQLFYGAVGAKGSVLNEHLDTGEYVLCSRRFSVFCTMFWGLRWFISVLR